MPAWVKALHALSVWASGQCDWQPSNELIVRHGYAIELVQWQAASAAVRGCHGTRALQTAEVESCTADQRCDALGDGIKIAQRLAGPPGRPHRSLLQLSSMPEPTMAASWRSLPFELQAAVLQEFAQGVSSRYAAFSKSRLHANQPACALQSWPGLGRDTPALAASAPLVLCLHRMLTCPPAHFAVTLCISRLQCSFASRLPPSWRAAKPSSVSTLVVTTACRQPRVCTPCWLLWQSGPALQRWTPAGWMSPAEPMTSPRWPWSCNACQHWSTCRVLFVGQPQKPSQR